MDGEERKIAALFAAFEEINDRMDGATKRFETAIARIDPAVRGTVKEAVTTELSGLQANVGEASAALQRLRRAADWRATLWSGALVLLVMALTLGGFWLLTPARAEMIALRAERAQLQAAIDLFASRGGRADLRPCDEHLCVRVDTGKGRYGEARDYFVIKGY